MTAPRRGHKPNPASSKLTTIVPRPSSIDSVSFYGITRRGRPTLKRIFRNFGLWSSKFWIKAQFLQQYLGKRIVFWRFGGSTRRKKPNNLKQRFHGEIMAIFDFVHGGLHHTERATTDTLP